MTEREVYPNAPIVLVAFEIKHSVCDPLDSRQVAQFSSRLREALPLPDRAVSLQISPNGGPNQQPIASVSPRWLSRDKRTALTIRQEALVLETTHYAGYGQMRALLSVALGARSDIGIPAGVERVGLRYIDEIRPPVRNGDDAPVWAQWVDESLLGPVRVAESAGLVAAQHLGQAVFSGRADRALVLRYGDQMDYAVASTPQLRRPLPPPGPLFKLDIDSFWQAGGDVPMFDVGTLLSLTDELHDPVRNVFERMITERFREEVLRRG